MALTLYLCINALNEDYFNRIILILSWIFRFVESLVLDIREVDMAIESRYSSKNVYTRIKMKTITNGESIY